MSENLKTYLSLSPQEQDFFNKVVERISNQAHPALEDLCEQERILFSGVASLALIAADVDRVKGYVFESAKLPEMRGASLILDLLNVKDSDDQENDEQNKWGGVRINGKQIQGIPQLLHDELQLPKKSLIYASGGGALIIAPLAMAADIKREIESLYIKTTLTATTTAVYEPIRLRQLLDGIVAPDDWFKQAKQAQGAALRIVQSHNKGSKGFGQLYSLLGYKLRREKDRKAIAPIFEVSPFTERCEFCGIRPSFKLPKFAEDPICEVCFRKRQEHWFENLQSNDKQQSKQRKAAHSFYVNNFTRYLDDQKKSGNELPYWTGVLNFKEVGEWTNIDSPPDLKAIANAATEKRVGEYIGIIYADGNDIGAMIDAQSSPMEFKNFAKNVRDIVETAVFKSLGNLLDSPRKKPHEYSNKKGHKTTIEHIYHPFEIISIGGDDVYLFVPPDRALEIALSICREVENNPANIYNLTLSAGVLIAHVTTPVYFSREVVEGLLKNAKRRSKSGSTPISTIDFQVITADTAISKELETYRQQAYFNERFQEWLTTRPYTLCELEAMIKLVRELKEQNFPLSQLYALREAVTRGPQPRASNFYNYQRSRSKDFRETYQLLHTYLSEDFQKAYQSLHAYLGTRSLMENSGTSRLPFWKPGDGYHKDKLLTPIVDLVEMYRFVRKRQTADEVKAMQQSEDDS